MSLQEAVEMLPHFRDPINDLHQLHVPYSIGHFCFDQLSPEVAPQETLDRLRVVGTEHPSIQVENNNFMSLAFYTYTLVAHF